MTDKQGLDTLFCSWSNVLTRFYVIWNVNMCCELCRQVFKDVRISIVAVKNSSFFVLSSV